ncbi:M23 family metallopeptidase [Phocaeicola plebeius]|uniref:M23 family metallopeptidase n=1 Tax=Phocaeicola plebeius TaxID=310297 RepID=UPI003A920FD0
MRQKMILALVLGGMLSAQAQHVQESKFCSPFDFPILLSANFGELRPNHFHNGLDIKTQGVTGKPIHCIADGYVSRVAVLHGGYGQAIYVTHPNGLTSVYGHVISFAKNIQACVRQYQYAHETFVCDLKFQPGQFPVKKGDIIALSGNEGASAGPHLHLELRRTETGEYIDPMPYFKHLLKDSKAPVGSLIGIYPIQGKGVVNGASHKKLLAIGNLKQPVHAWGEIYTGISAKDYMDGTSNFYGVHSVTLYVDSVQVFNSTTDKVLPDENRMINGFTDYEELTRTRRLIMRSYKLPGNRLRLLHTNENRGAVTIDEERDYHFRYVLEDNFGNRRTYQFIVKGKRQDIPEYKPEANEMLYWNRTNVIQKPGMELVVPRYHVYENVPLRTDMRGDSSRIAFDYILDAGRTPIHSYCDLSIGLRHMPVADTTKYYIVQKAGKWRSSMGGKYASGWIKTRVRSLGTFSVDVDTIAPQITPIGQGGWRTSRNIRFRIKDMESGIGSYKVYIDGKFVLFGLKKGILVIQDPEKVKKGVPHKLEVTVTDQCGNMARKEYKF